MIALYSYLLTETAVRDPAKKYLLIATVTEGRKKGALGKSDNSGSSGIIKSGGNIGEMRVMQTKMLKNFDRKMNTLSSKVEKTLKDI